MIYGATEKDWAFFSETLKLKPDLLPVVSNPTARISPTSTLKAAGKVPSVYNYNGQVIGFMNWTSYEAKDADIKHWRKCPDYGICVQTREVRALDIDIEDGELSEQIENAVFTAFGHIPVRRRDNSAKKLYMIRVPSGFTSKRILQTDKGNIEYLAHGQQFVAVGTHPSGSRYEWYFLDSQIPEVAAEQFEEFWQKLASQLGANIVMPGNRLKSQTQGDTSGSLGKDQELLDFLQDQGYVKGRGANKALYIQCPFESEHTSDSGVSSTVYFPAGTNGHTNGAFKCMHAHCAHRTQEDFLNKIKFHEKQFESLPAEAKGERLEIVLERNKQGLFKPTLSNLIKILNATDEYSGFSIRFDKFTDNILIRYSGDSTLSYREFTDTDYVRLRYQLETRNFAPIGNDLMRDVVRYHADNSSFDSARDWLDALVWDGTPRVSHFIATYLNETMPQTPYWKSIGEYLFTAMAGRVLTPGVKADMVPVLVSKQGTRKTTLVSALAPLPQSYTEIDLTSRDDDLARQLRGKLVVEINELRGLRTREAGHIKSFISRTCEEWVPKYKEYVTRYHRRCVFIGTTNDSAFLTDLTGNRRWLPVRVLEANIDALTRDRDQLWAEGKELYKQHGVMWQRAEEEGSEQTEQFVIEHEWTEPIRRWLEHEGDHPFTVYDVLIGAIGRPASQHRRVDQMAVRELLARFGRVPEVDQTGRLIFVPRDRR